VGTPVACTAAPATDGTSNDGDGSRADNASVADAGTSAAAPASGGPANVDWGALGFGWHPTPVHVVASHTRGGGWSPPTAVAGDPYIRLHVGATALQYGASCLEGLKARRRPDGAVVLFRPTAHADRFAASAARLAMPPVPTDVFLAAVKAAVVGNAAYVPPAGAPAALYLRPLLLGTGPRIGLAPADEYALVVLATPVSEGGGGAGRLLTAGATVADGVTAAITDAYDRSAAGGLGGVKAGANYAADLLPATAAKAAGFPLNLYLDAATHTAVEEFGAANFVAVRRGRSVAEPDAYVTPESPSILRSITNDALAVLAAAAGMVVERRRVAVAEIEALDEVAAVGTGASVTPVDRLVWGDRVLTVGSAAGRGGGGSGGGRLVALASHLAAIQQGEAPDVHGWCEVVDM